MKGFFRSSWKFTSMLNRTIPRMMLLSGAYFLSEKIQENKCISVVKRSAQFNTIEKSYKTQYHGILDRFR